MRSIASGSTGSLVKRRTMRRLRITSLKSMPSSLSTAPHTALTPPLARPAASPLYACLPRGVWLPIGVDGLRVGLAGLVRLDGRHATERAQLWPGPGDTRHCQRRADAAERHGADRANRRRQRARLES